MSFNHSHEVTLMEIFILGLVLITAMLSVDSRCSAPAARGPHAG
jgi:hypothetical protein